MTPPESSNTLQQLSGLRVAKNQSQIMFAVPPMSKFTPYRSTFNLTTTADDDDVNDAATTSTMKEDHRYDALRTADNHSDSSTEVEDWEPETAVRPRRRKRNGFWSKFRRYRWVVDTALLLVIFGMLVEKRWKKYMDKSSHHQYEFAGDLTGFAPRCTSPLSSKTPPPNIQN